jgi:outer membrane receptor protein involved in Fe transport
MDAQLSYRLPQRRGIVSLSANNLLDETSLLHDTDPANPTFFPERTFLLRVSLSF